MSVGIALQGAHSGLWFDRTSSVSRTDGGGSRDHVTSLETALRALEIDTSSRVIRGAIEHVIDSAEKARHALRDAYGSIEPPSSEAQTRPGAGRQQALEASRAIDEFSRALDELFDRSSRGLRGSTLLDQARQEIHAVVANAVEGNGPQYELTRGLTFDFSEDAASVLALGGGGRSDLEQALRAEGRDASTYTALLGSARSDGAGLLRDIAAGLQAVLTDPDLVENALGSHLDAWL